MPHCLQKKRETENAVLNSKESVRDGNLNKQKDARSFGRAMLFRTKET